MNAINDAATVKRYVDALCDHGFMNGWFGDTSQEFRDEQITALLNLSDREQREWLDRNRFNLSTYCGVVV